MANEKEIVQLKRLIESTKETSAALAPIYASASLALKYMADNMAILLADIEGRTPLTEMERASTQHMEAVLHAENDVRHGAKEEQADRGEKPFDLAREQDILFGRTFDLAETQPTEERKRVMGRT